MTSSDKIDACLYDLGDWVEIEKPMPIHPSLMSEGAKKYSATPSSSKKKSFLDRLMSFFGFGDNTCQRYNKKEK
jgi:hypothetical protein